MSKIELHVILEKYRQGTIEPAELAILEAWYLQWKPVHTAIKEDELDSLKQQVWIHLEQEVLQKKPHWLRSSLRVAAVFFMLAVPLSYFSYHSWNKSAVNYAQENPLAEFKPGSERATLILADGRKISLKGADSGLLAEQGQARVINTSAGRLVYEQFNVVKSVGEKIIYNTMLTPRGGTYQLTLADGTKVWLNSGSSLSFPVTFLNEERKVRLSGEAYFEVAALAGKPFRVETVSQEITVLGTHFNVKAYADDPLINTTLLEGSIRLKNLKSGQSDLLKEGQQAILYPNEPSFRIDRVNAQDAVSWKKGYFIFDNQPLENVLQTLGRWYNADFEYEGISGERIGGTFSRSAQLVEILRGLEQIGQFRFKARGKKITVTLNGKEDRDIQHK